MVSNNELLARVNADKEETHTAIGGLSNRLDGIDSSILIFQDMMAKMQASLDSLSQTIKGKSPVLGDFSSVSYVPPPTASPPPSPSQHLPPPPPPPPYGVGRYGEIFGADKGARLDVLDFNGDQNPEEYLDWIHSLEIFSKWYGLSEPRKLMFAEAKLKGTARVWWIKYQKQNQTRGIGAINTWAEMYAAMNRRFLPLDYKQRTHLKFTQLRQDNMTVEEYVARFYYLATRSDFDWDEDVLVAQFRNGLHPQISASLASNRLHTMEDAVQVAYQVEENLKRPYNRRNFSDTYSKGNNFVKQSPPPEKSFSKPQESGSSMASSRPTRPYSPPRRSYDRPPSKPRAEIQCYTCKGFGHFASHCPNRSIAFADKEELMATATEEQRKNEIVYLAAEHDSDDSDSDADQLHQPFMVLRPLLTTQIPEEDDWRRGNIFQTRVRCNGSLCTMIIDGGSCTNAVSEDMVNKLGLKTEPHPHPYKVGWINNNNLKVHERCLVTYSIGGLIDTVRCDVLPLKICHLLLGRPWMFDKKVQHDGYENTYTFKFGGLDMQLLPAKHLPAIKLKKNASSLLLQRIPSDGILGPYPDSTGSSSFEKRRVDAVAMSWMDRYEPLWLPKPKPNRLKPKPTFWSGKGW